MSARRGEGFIRPEKFWKGIGLRARQKVVHLGCGPGFFVVAAAKIVGKDGQVIGVDILEEKLEETLARARREGVEKIIRTIRNNLEGDQGSTLDDAMADWVLVANILHQSDPATILREAARIVAPKGMVVAIEWSTADSPLGPPNEERLSDKEILAVAKEAGLELKESFVPSPYHYGLLFSRAKQ